MKLAGARAIAPVGAAALLLVFLAWKIIAFGAADILAADDPRAALFLDPAHPQALALALQSELSKEKPDFSAAKRDAGALLTHDPLAPGGLSLLGVAAYRQGDTARADRMMRVAAAHLPIDLVSHGWLYEQARSRGDAAAALKELDILLRARPFLAERLAQTTAGLTGPAAESALARLLATNPPWRKPFLVAYAGAADPSAIARLHDGLRAARAAPDADETRPFLERLVAERRIDAGLRAWRAFLAPAQRKASGLLYNADFKYPLTNLPFDWQFVPTWGASAKVDTAGGEAALDVEFTGTRVAFNHVRHLLLLPPGDYAFTGMASTAALQNPLGLRWRVSCLEDQRNALGMTQPIAGDRPAHAFRLAFTVPANGCAAQMLVLELAARIESDWQVEGAARYWRLAVEPATVPK